MTTSTPRAPDATADLRDLLERAVERLEGKRQDPQRVQTAHERERIGGKIEGVKLALAFISGGERIAIGADGPVLAITPAIVRAFDIAYRAMLHEETQPLGRRDHRPAVRVYAQTEILADMLRASGVPGIPEDEPGVVLSALKDLLSTPEADARWGGAHATHCCARHGCKYGDSTCPVARGRLTQEYPCEQCADDLREGWPVDLVHAAEATDTETLCGEPVTDDTLVAIQDWRGHVTCRPCREEAEL